MILELTDEQAAFQQEIAAFAAERLAPGRGRRSTRTAAFRWRW